MVGCLLVSTDERVVGWGLHRRCGEAHAERMALAAAGAAARDATAYVTLQPCNGVGRTGPCTVALIEAGVRRVVYGVSDPHPKAEGGVERLRRAGIAVEQVPCPEAAAVSAPFIHTVRTGQPWVVAKWAQSLDGRIATERGESQWISSERSRRLVHRERGRIDAIVTGIGTVLADDPMLTARGVRRRRRALRVVIDPEGRTPPTSALARSAGEAPLLVACRETVAADPTRSAALRALGVEFVGLGDDGRAASDAIALRPLLRRLAAERDVSTLLVEAGPRLLGAFFRQGLVNEALVFVAPILLGDRGRPSVAGVSPERLGDAIRLEVMDQRLRGGDLVVRLRQPTGG